ncbi:hypothetical protein QVD17_42379 [Tagetes erecta]|uniref:Protein TIC 214 n=2 Tax=Tagetes TaxID=13707 RepID=A0AAD8N8K8_TARER|nr:hypothetical protein QVD17_42443 [Tagetes erecta]KAK1405930.1 hypothetical protein QVD17_42379 [Tagetes erecta]
MPVPHQRIFFLRARNSSSARMGQNSRASTTPGLWNKGVSRTYTGVLTVIFKSPQVGFEPTTNRLTADRSTTELLRNNGRFDLIEFHSRSQPMTNMSSKLPSNCNRKEKGRFVMILKSFLLGNLVSLCMKIINSVVVVGLYYGFLTTFSIGPSYLFLLRAHVMEEGEEGAEKKVSATTGFITGQLIMFISIYYAPLHLALGRPHTITVLALPYLLFHFFCNNHKNFFDYGSTTRNSMRNLSIQCVFLNNLIFQLLNYFILPSSMLARLVNIFMFRCNSKMLFVTSSFFGWIIGHILFMKWIGKT